MAASTDRSSGGDSAWQHAACMLLTLGPDDRVIAVNQRFLDGAGYHRSDVLDRVFWDELLAVGSKVFYRTQLAPVLELDRRLTEVMVDLRAADGHPIPALLSAARRDGDAEPDGHRVTDIALMTVPDRRAFEDRLRRARDEAEQAHRSAERALHAEAHARLRLELLAQANTALASSLDVDVALQQLARTLASRLADWCLIYLTDTADPADLHWAAGHSDPARQGDLELLADHLLADTRSGSKLHDVLHDNSATLLTTISDDQQSESTDSDKVRALYSAVGLGSLIVAPAAARHTRVATIALGRGDQRPPFSADDLADVTDVAARAGIVIDNLRRHAREHSNSIALQHALLTTAPHAPGFRIATRYLPATNGNEVGGDWYDALLQPDGTPLLVIGDVVGHDIHAAAAMGQLRGIIRTLAYTSSGAAPSQLLTRADATARGLGVNVLATAVLARLHHGSKGETILHWTVAGHPPPLLVTDDGVRVLHAAPDRLLGLPTELQQPRHDHGAPLRPGDTLVLYTDGLVERADEFLDEGLAALAEAIGPLAGRDPDRLCDAVLQARRGDTRDDIALLAIQVTD